MIDDCCITISPRLRSRWFFIPTLFGEVFHPNFRALYRGITLVPLRGTQTWQLLSNRNICHWVLPFKQKFITLYQSSDTLKVILLLEQKLFSLQKLMQWLIFWSTQEPPGAAIWCHAMHKLGNSNALYYKKKNAAKLKCCKTPSY